MSLNQTKGLKAGGFGTGFSSSSKASSRVHALVSSLPPQTFRSCWETGLTDTRWLRWSQASPHDVPKPEERLLLLKTRKRSQTWQNCAADPFLKPFLAKGIAFCGRLIKMHSFGQGRGLPSSSAVCKTEEGQLQD